MVVDPAVVLLVVEDAGRRVVVGTEVDDVVLPVEEAERGSVVDVEPSVVDDCVVDGAVGASVVGGSVVGASVDGVVASVVGGGSVVGVTGSRV